ncbi:MAG: L-glyceraldehyde 3-phosphate reductase [Terrimicrobiaceae bacterium]
MSTPPPISYEKLPYRRCGRSGISLPAVSLGLWQNFGASTQPETARELIATALDSGITHFDLANNYGPPPGSAEECFGRLISSDFAPLRDELIISTKAGYRMGPGPYGDGGSRKYLLSSLDASLRRLRLDYVDIFYHHRPDPDTPLEESMGALDSAVRQGKALYAGISNYDASRAAAAFTCLRAMGTPCLIHQPRYSLLDRRPESGLLDVLDQEGVGAIIYSPLEQGILAGRYLDGVPDGSRITRGGPFLKTEHLTPGKLETVRRLAGIARDRGQTPAQLALAWTLRRPVVTSALIGASRPEQIIECAKCLDAGPLTEAELGAIEAACSHA